MRAASKYVDKPCMSGNVPFAISASNNAPPVWRLRKEGTRARSQQSCGCAANAVWRGAREAGVAAKPCAAPSRLNRRASCMSTYEMSPAAAPGSDKYEQKPSTHQARRRRIYLPSQWPAEAVLFSLAAVAPAVIGCPSTGELPGSKRTHRFVHFSISRPWGGRH